MPERILFLTGRLARPRLEKVLATMASEAFTFEIRDMGVKVAALMTEGIIRRRLEPPIAADRVVVPGRCRANLEALAAHYDCPFERGPEELKDLPAFFGKSGGPPDLSRYDVRIFAEIVEASELSPDAILERAVAQRAAGADVIDLGCLPDTPFPHLEASVALLKAQGLAVSIDSADPEELRRGARAGADYLFSLTEASLDILDEGPAVPVLIPAEHGNLESLERAMDALDRTGRPYLADPILDPIHFGFAASLERYIELRRRRPNAELLMGTGNLTELTEADSGGVTAMLMGLVSELRISNVLVVQVSPHTRRTLQEHDAARRLMYAARDDASLPKDYGDHLLGLHERNPFPNSPEEVAEIAAQITDANYRIEVTEEGIHVYNKDGHRLGTEAYGFYPTLGVEDDASHAFYLGVELARAEIAWRLGKRYTQDNPLRWGVALDEEEQDLTRFKKAGETLQAKGKKRAGVSEPMPMIRETIVTTQAPDGRVHIAPIGIIADGDGWVIAPFKPSTTLENLRANPHAVANYCDDVLIFAGCLTGRRDWPTRAASRIPGARLEAALNHAELSVDHVEEDELRPRFHCHVTHEESHAGFRGFNRAQAAVIEAAILVSRLHMLPPEKIASEIAYLEIAIGKTAGPREQQAWDWLMVRVRDHLDSDAKEAQR